MWIERNFSVHGFGTVISGIPQSGMVNIGQKLTLQPDGLAGRVRGLEVYGQKSDSGQAGECTAVNLADIDIENLTRGKVLCEDESFPPSTMVEAHLQILPQVKGLIKDYSEVHLHIGTTQVMCKIAMLSEVRKMTGGQSGFVQLRMDKPISAAPGERFVIRGSVSGLADGRMTTLAGGMVLSVSDKRLRRNRPWTIASLEAKLNAANSPSQRCELEIKEMGKEINSKNLARLAYMKIGETEKIVESLLAAEKIVTLEDGLVIHRSVLDALKNKIIAKLEKFHVDNPMRGGIKSDELADESETSRMLFGRILRDLKEEKKIEELADAINLIGRGAKISPEDQKLCKDIESALQTGGLTPPGQTELAESLGVSPQRAETMLQLLIDQALVIRLNEKIVMHRDAVNQAKKTVLKLFSEQSGFETTAFRDAIGVSRKFAVPLLDYFDTVHLTVRTGSRRTPGKEAKKNKL